MLSWVQRTPVGLKRHLRQSLGQDIAMNDRAPSSVVIVGGGLIGLTTAVFLNDRGVDVTIIDSGELGGGAAKGNAGLLCSALLEPLPAPGSFRTALKSLLDPAGALRMRPSEFPKLAPWLLRFALKANARSYQSGRVALGGLNASSLRLGDRLRGLGVTIDTGPPLLVAMHDPAEAEHFRAELELMRQFGGIVPPTLLTADEIHAAIPALTGHVATGFFLDNDLPIDPRVMIDSMIGVLRARGVRVVEHRTIRSVDHTLGTVRSLTLSDGSEVPTEHILIAAGAGSHAVGKLFGMNIPVVAGQGYNFVLPSSAAFTHPVIFQDAHFVATPLADGVRLGGTMELTGDRPKFDQRRVDAIVRSARPLLDLEYDKSRSTWAGSRPLTSDGLPIMGRSKTLSNVSLAVGHGMYGLTLAPATGAAMTELLCDPRPETNLQAFSPTRFGL